MTDHILSPDELLRLRLDEAMSKRGPMTEDEVKALAEEVRAQMHAEAVQFRDMKRMELMEDVCAIEERIEGLKDQHAAMLRALAELEAKPV